MAGTGAVRDLRRARRGRQPPRPPPARGRRAARRPRRLLHGEPPPLPRGGVGLPLRRRRLHGVLVAPDERRARLHPRTTAAPRSSSRRSTRPTRPPRCSPTRPASAAPDARRHGRRLRVLRGRRRRATGRAAARSDRRAPTCCTRRARPGCPKGVTRAFVAGAAGDVPAFGVTGVLQLLFGGHADVGVPLARAAVPRRAAALLDGDHALGGTVVVMEHFDAEEFLALVERHRVTHTPGRADDVRAPAQAARRGARPLRRVVAASA